VRMTPAEDGKGKTDEALAAQIRGVVMAALQEGAFTAFDNPGRLRCAVRGTAGMLKVVARTGGSYRHDNNHSVVEGG